MPAEGAAMKQNASGVVVTGGDSLLPELCALIDAATVVIAADSGLDRLWELGRLPHRVVGDLDSVSPQALGAARDRGVVIEQHPADKDATDTELAIWAATRCEVDRLTVVSGGGDRLDHLLGWLSVLGTPRLAAIPHLDAWCGTTHIQILHGPCEHGWSGDTAGAVVSLIPWGGECHGVTTAGLRWALTNATLAVASSRGISNQMVDGHAHISLTDGVLAVLRPHRGVIPVVNLTPSNSGDHHHDV